MRRLLWTRAGWEDYLWWKVHDKRVRDRINALIDDVQRDAFRGIGKPEPLKGNLRGKWSRRITDEHRLVYEVRTDALVIHQCRFHY
jgi:toxin YoeB